MEKTVGRTLRPRSPHRLFRFESYSGLRVLSRLLSLIGVLSRLLGVLPLLRVLLSLRVLCGLLRVLTLLRVLRRIHRSLAGRRRVLSGLRHRTGVGARVCAGCAHGLCLSLLAVAHHDKEHDAADDDNGQNAKKNPLHA